MKVDLIESVDEFITMTTAFRAADPLRTNVIGSVSLAVATGRTTYDDYHWWVVHGDDDDIVGLAMRTSPFNMVATPMPLDAARALGRSVGQFDDGVPGITGSEDIVRALVEGYVESKSPGSTRALVEERRDLLYELEELTTPDVEGFGRAAREEEIELLAEMLGDFYIEVELAPLSPTDALEGIISAFTAGSIYCWEVAGDVVAFAGHAPVVTTESIVIGRVGPVYTPPEYRRRGFGSAVTAYVSRRLLERGARVILFTDAANPTSNSIYREIGYRRIDELVEMRFT